MLRHSGARASPMLGGSWNFATLLMGSRALQSRNHETPARYYAEFKIIYELCQLRCSFLHELIGRMYYRNMTRNEIKQF